MNAVFWIEGDPALKFAIVQRPRGDEWLQFDLDRIRRAGVDLVVSHLEPGEADSLGLADESAVAEQVGLEFLSYPIPDVTVPSHLDSFNAIVAVLAERLRKGQAIGIHCRGCIGRSTVTAACTLIHMGWNAQTALQAIETSRGCAVPDTLEQRNWILRYQR